ncbi:hypothetical protein EU803_05295 [Loktanella sp. IMCC34160]|uniref:hypothetical protein n=1 Tax=Loktanella sp. IMCC34160 TaxID=2510646 RepID=UPI00101CE0F0|nr:hypothetical protein [Loktanella sp. IMCC34160]RYG91872.1 hypothetical protein EU803_05295 [Loktanella sp. IMCC34160]
MAEQARRQVRRRRVFYIPGYDPIHPRRYRELYRKESAAQAEISGYDIGISPKQGDGAYGWEVEARIDDTPVEASVEVLVWSDIVRGSMSNTIPATYLQLVRTAWTYIASGTLRRLMWMRKGPVIAALYPVGMLILQLLIAVVLGFIAGRIVGAVLGFVPIWGEGGFWRALRVFLDTAGFWVPFLVVVPLVLRWFKARDGKLFAYYLMHDYAYSARWKGENPPELEARMAEFGDQIADALHDPSVDEVLVVGHSSGAHLGVSILADLIRAGRVPATGPALGFLSLGQVVPMVSFLPRAWRLRADLMFLSQRRELAWIDVTAPGDGCAFALCDPVAVSGVAPRGQKWPLVLSAAFTQTLSPERWKELRWRFFRLHFQYLCAFDRPGDYDYFQITAGPVTLADRYDGRAPSQSRIDVAASKYTTVVAP